MHELSLTQSILDIVAQYAERHGFDRVNSLRLSFGRLSGIDPQAMRFAFEVAAQGTPAEGAEIICDIQPVIVDCLACETQSRPETYAGTCPHCGSFQVQLTGGTEELQFVDMDVD